MNDSKGWNLSLIHIEIKTESLFEIPYLKISMKNNYITGGKYRLSAQIKNMGTDSFSGGQFHVIVRWPLLSVFWNFQVGTLEPGETGVEEFGVSDVLDDRAALFLVSGEYDNKTPIPFCDKDRNQLEAWPKESEFPGYVHVHTIIPKNAEELYQLWAFLIAAISLVSIFVKDIVISFLQLLTSG